VNPESLCKNKNKTPVYEEVRRSDHEATNLVTHMSCAEWRQITRLSVYLFDRRKSSWKTAILMCVHLLSCSSYCEWSS